MSVQKIDNRPARSQVLLDDPDTIAETLQSNPRDWYVIAGGPRERLSVLSQTAYRIRQGKHKSFRPSELGTYDVEVTSSHQDEADRDYPVQVIARWVPAKKIITNN